MVEVFQGAGWSGGTAAPAEMIALYRVTCEARGCPMLAVDGDLISHIRARIVELAESWAATPVGGELRLMLA